MNESKIDELFNQLLNEFPINHFEERYDIDVSDIREDLLIICENWDQFRGRDKEP